MSTEKSAKSLGEAIDLLFTLARPIIQLNAQMARARRNSIRDAKVAVVIPTYNEADNMWELFDAFQLMQDSLPNLLVYLVDDNSPDGTLGVARGASIRTGVGAIGINRMGRTRGLGNAYKDGFDMALEDDFDADYIVQMDADLSHDPLEIIAMVRQSKAYGHGVVVGSRYIEGGSTPDWPLRRRLLSRSANWVARKYLGLSTRDVTSGFKLFTRDALADIEYEAFRSNDFGFQMEMAQACERTGVTIGETPICFKDRTKGESKMSAKIILDTLTKVRRL